MIHRPSLEKHYNLLVYRTDNESGATYEIVDLGAALQLSHKFPCLDVHDPNREILPAKRDEVVGRVKFHRGDGCEWKRKLLLEEAC